MARINGVTKITKGCSLNCKPYYSSDNFNDTVTQTCCQTDHCNDERVMVVRPLRCYSCVGCAENYRGIIWNCPLSPEYSCSVRIYRKRFIFASRANGTRFSFELNYFD